MAATLDGATDLALLLERLRDGGFPVDARQYLIATDLMLACAAQGERLDTSVERLRDHLGPVFCTSPDEQARFADIVRAWLEPPLPPPPPPPTPDSEPPFARWRRARWAALLVPALIVAAVALALPHRPTTVAPPLNVRPEPPPPHKADAPHASTWIEPLPEIRPHIAAPYVAPGRISWRRVALASGGPALATFLFWWAWSRLRRRLILRRLPVRDRPELTDLADGVAFAPDGQGPALDRAARALRRPRAQEAVEIDMPASIAAAASSGGLAPLVYAKRRAMPDHVALIERCGGADHQARIYDQILDQLASRDLKITRYAFDGDMRVCFERGSLAHPQKLANLLGHHRQAAWLVFTEARRFFNPISGEPEPWLELFRGPSRRALFTPNAPHHWTSHERTMAETGFVVLPAGAEGLAEFGEVDGEWNIEHLFPAPFARPYPRLLVTSPALATERECPPADIVGRLVRELKGYLGPRGLCWLAACAVYPEIEWRLTLELAPVVWATTGAAARSRSSAPEAASQPADRRALLAALSRLPWFRLGFMPDWLRAALLSQLSDVQEQAVREWLSRRLEAMARETLARAGGGTDSDGGLSIGAWTDPIELLKTGAPGSAMRDAVFIGYMAGARIPATAIDAPSIFRRLFRRVRGLPAYQDAVLPAPRTAAQRLAARTRGLVAWRPALGWLAAALATGGVAVAALLVSRASVVRPAPPPVAPVLGMGFTSDGALVATHSGDVMQVWSLDGKEVHQTTSDWTIRSFGSRRDGTMVLTDKGPSGHVAVIDYDMKFDGVAWRATLTKTSETGEFDWAKAHLPEGARPPEGSVIGVRLGPSPERVVALLTTEPRVRLIFDRQANWAPIDILPSASPLSDRDFDLSSDGSLLALVTNNHVYVWNVHGLGDPILAEIGPITGVWFAADDPAALVIAKPGKVSVHHRIKSGAWDQTLLPREVTASFVTLNWQAQLAVIAVGGKGAAGTGGTALLWNLRSGEVVEIQKRSAPFSVALDHNSRTVAVYGQDRVSLFSVHQGEGEPSPTDVGPPALKLHRIAVLNQAKSLLSDAEVSRAIGALNTQIARDVGPVWGVDARLELAHRDSSKADATVTLTDGEPDVVTALGYHDVKNGRPYTKIFLKLFEKGSLKWRITFSHVVLEMLVDPLNDRTVPGPHPHDATRRGKHVLEICNAVETESYAIDGVQVSNFVLPGYFKTDTPAGTPVDFLAKSTGQVELRPFAIKTGGYAQFYDDSKKAWETVFENDSKN